MRSNPLPRPVIIGLYGLPECGKSFLLDRLQTELGDLGFKFYEGSRVIDQVCPGGLNTFRGLGESGKTQWRRKVIRSIQQECRNYGKAGVVAGHLMFWKEEEDVGQNIWAQSDSDVYTHILYLNTAADRIAENIARDTERCRSSSSVAHLRNWLQTERTELKKICQDAGILLAVLPEHLATVDKTKTFLQDFRVHNDKLNAERAKADLEQIIQPVRKKIETALVVDADKTLAAQDTSREYPLPALFGGSWAYSYAAFRQAMLMYEEPASDDEFDKLCNDATSKIQIHVELLCLLKLLKKQHNICALVITRGQRKVWQSALRQIGLEDTVKVIGGGRMVDGYVVMPAIKAKVVTILLHWISICCEEQIMPMFVTGDEPSRSKSMDAQLRDAIDANEFQPFQALLPPSTSPRLDITCLPLIDITSPSFVEKITRRNRRRDPIEILHRTETAAAKLLMTPMRDKSISGPLLREAHRKAGQYLAMGPLADLIGLETHNIQHVQGSFTTGHRLLREKEMLVIALMRGGEPMALRVSEVFPLAMFLHAKVPGDVTRQHLSGRLTVLLVDSVVHNGGTALKFIQRVRSLHATIQIVLVAGVVNERPVTEGSDFLEGTSHYHRVALVSLRLSKNHYIGHLGGRTRGIGCSTRWIDLGIIDQGCSLEKGGGGEAK
ncbi:hypothetical protein N7512_002346 [Penicillium capsulatum]|nr:hypothetical protein N7512_002346 [Penicillium capsulatum]